MLETLVSASHPFSASVPESCYMYWNVLLGLPGDWCIRLTASRGHSLRPTQSTGKQGNGRRLFLRRSLPALLLPPGEEVETAR